MKLIAQQLDEAVELLPQLEALSTKLAGIKDEDLRQLFISAADPLLQKRASLINTSHCGGVEYVYALVRAATMELKRLGDLNDLESAFPEVVDPIPSVETEAPNTEEVEVHLQIEGPDGVEVVQEDGQIYVVLPDNAVLKLSEASTTECAAILAKRQS